MRLKSYFAGTVEAAMTLAARELGDEAMLVYSREAAAETRYLGRYEVVFAIPEPAQPIPTPGDCAARSGQSTEARAGGTHPLIEKWEERAPATSSSRDWQQDDRLSEIRADMLRLRDQVEALSAKVRWRSTGQPAGDHETGARPVFENAASAYRDRIEVVLAAAEVPKDLAARLCAQWFAAAAHRHASQHLPILRQIVSGTARTDCDLSEGESRARIVALVGPSGTGKTTTIVKLAARYGLAGRRSAQFISFDNCRIGGAAQLATFASILGVPFRSVDTVGGLLQALEECQNKGLILIDTAGYDKGDDGEAAELARLLQSRTDIDVHLTLSASMKPADLIRAADRFTPFRADKLIFTRLDETSTFGPIMAEAVRQGKPLSFFSNGPQIPEDLQEASPELVTTLLLDGLDCGMQRIIDDDGFPHSAPWGISRSGNEAAA